MDGGTYKCLFIDCCGGLLFIWVDNEGRGMMGLGEDSLRSGRTFMAQRTKLLLVRCSSFMNAKCGAPVHFSKPVLTFTKPQDGEVGIDIAMRTKMLKEVEKSCYSYNFSLSVCIYLTSAFPNSPSTGDV